MISPDSELRKHLQTVAAAIGYTICDRVDEGQAYPFIYISDISNIDMPIAGGRMWDVDLLLDVVTSYNQRSGGRKQADMIGNAVLTALLDSPYTDLGAYVIVKATLVNSNYLDEQTDSSYLIRKLLRINFQIELQ